jgi:tol-pal system protein YbgF
MNKLKFIIFLLTIGIFSLAIADEIPIEDFSTTATTKPQSLSIDQQLARINKQIAALQQQMQQLRADLDAERHTIDILQHATLSHTAGNPELQAYQSAFNLLRSKKYPAAITKMQGYLKDYPDGKYAVNAHYWLGEIYYLQKKLPQAITEFQTVLDHYPNSEKVPDAMLKLAMIYSAKGEYEKSHQLFQKIKNKYPNSAAARLMEQQQKVAIN